MGKLLGLAALGLIGVAVAREMPALKRYQKISAM